VKQKVYFQPKNTGLCGQYAIANLLGITPDESIKAFGKRGGKTRKSGTGTKDVAKAVKELGYECDERLTLIKPGQTLPDNCLVSVAWKGPPIYSGLRRGAAGHWVAYKSGMIICSGDGLYSSIESYVTKNNGYANGYLEVKPK
jgi:hypothetical protein